MGELNVKKEERQEEGGAGLEEEVRVKPESQSESDRSQDPPPPKKSRRAYGSSLDHTDNPIIIKLKHHIMAMKNIKYRRYRVSYPTNFYRPQ